MTGTKMEGIKIAVDKKIAALRSFKREHKWFVRIAWTILIFCIGAAIGSQG